MNSDHCMVGKPSENDNVYSYFNWIQYPIYRDYSSNPIKPKAFLCCINPVWKLFFRGEAVRECFVGNPLCRCPPTRDGSEIVE